MEKLDPNDWGSWDRDQRTVLQVKNMLKDDTNQVKPPGTAVSSNGWRDDMDKEQHFR